MNIEGWRSGGEVMGFEVSVGDITGDTTVIIDEAIAIAAIATVATTEEISTETTAKSTTTTVAPIATSIATISSSVATMNRNRNILLHLIWHRIWLWHWDHFFVIHMKWKLRKKTQ